MIKSDRFVICMLNPHIVQCIAVQVSMKNQHRLRGCVYKYVLNKIVYISRISYSAATQSILILKSPNTSERLRNALTIFKLDGRTIYSVMCICSIVVAIVYMMRSYNISCLKKSVI